MNLWHDPRALNTIANGMVMVAFACLMMAGIWWVGQRSTFDLLAIEVGSVNGRSLDHVSAASITALAVNRLEGNFFTVGLDQVRQQFEQVPWVRRAEVRRVWPNRLFVALEEHEVLARWNDDGGRFVNTHGELFSVNPAHVANHQNLLMLSGPVGSQMLVARRYAELSEQLLPLAMQPVALKLSDRQSWTAELDSGITLRMGRDEGVPVAERVARWVAAHPLIQARLNGRAEVVDLRYPNGFAVRAPGALEQDAGGRHHRIPSH
ncbi:MAG: cell division protein FtsQ/DivIB [Lautropia sp.]|nr:cell division protein FtsQ/DivIB [Lautropia sp.]